MAGVLGKYEWLANAAIEFGFPVIGAALGVPALAPIAAGLLKKALGMADSASLDAVKDTIQGDPETAKAAFEVANTEAAAKWATLAKAIEADADVAKTNIEQINQTIREENGKVSFWHWRNLLGYVVGFEILFFPLAAFGVVLFADAEKTTAVLTFANPLVTILGIASGLLGFVALDTTKKVTAAMTGQAPEGVIASAARAVTGKKK